YFDATNEKIVSIIVTPESQGHTIRIPQNDLESPGYNDKSDILTALYCGPFNINFSVDSNADGFFDSTIYDVHYTYFDNISECAKIHSDYPFYIRYYSSANHYSWMEDQHSGYMLTSEGGQNFYLPVGSDSPIVGACNVSIIPKTVTDIYVDANRDGIYEGLYLNQYNSLELNLVAGAHIYSSKPSWAVIHGEENLRYNNWMATLPNLNQCGTNYYYPGELTTYRAPENQYVLFTACSDQTTNVYVDINFDLNPDFTYELNSTNNYCHFFNSTTRSHIWSDNPISVHIHREDISGPDVYASATPLYPASVWNNEYMSAGLHPQRTIIQTHTNNTLVRVYYDPTPWNHSDWVDDITFFLNEGDVQVVVPPDDHIRVKANGTFQMIDISYTQGSLYDRGVMALTLPPYTETWSPNITSISRDPMFPTSLDAVNITVHITDNLGVDTVLINSNYTGSPINYEMDFLSGSNIDGYWNFTIPSVTAGYTVAYSIIVNDTSNNIESAINTW
ncbi:MAG: hypothetical protein ACTSR3_22620, partial [Candidatus Helarchaeota archaeon]